MATAFLSNGNDMLMMKKAGSRLFDFGETTHRAFIPSDEGDLFWVPKDELLNLHTSILIKAAIRHFLQNQETEAIWIGNVLNGEGAAARPRVEWSIMQDTISFEPIVQG
ncbi:hypothetical protein KET34_08895 [Paenibacillus pabuli]|nr:hypothetical protein KET34_08895 [Paenibacillus pabuli]